MKVSKKGKVSADLHVTADPFVLHRVVNDALHQAEVPVMAFSPKYLKQTLGKARRRAVADGQSWAWRLAHDDSPVNIEGASFTADGWLLLGLRVPVSRAGFGDRQAPVEIRDLHLSGGMCMRWSATSIQPRATASCFQSIPRRGWPSLPMS